MAHNQVDEISEHIAVAKNSGIDLEPSDFQVIDGMSTLDGMRPEEWLEAMTMS